MQLVPGLRTLGGESLPPLEFHFDVSHSRLSRQETETLVTELTRADFGDVDTVPRYGWEDDIPTEEDTTAFEYPRLTVAESRDPYEGYIALAPWSPGVPIGRIMLVDNLGNPIFHRRLFTSGFAQDFKHHANGWLTYFHSQTELRYFALDETYSVVDTIVTGNGYITDGHELLLLPNGNWLLMSYDPQPVAMDQEVPGGNPDAIVIGLIVQEVTPEGEVVFQWRSWDHMELTDTVIDLTTARVDYVHGNALELDWDGNILICSRHLDEITKISRETGEIMWRMGLHAPRNEFTFLNDSRGFTHPHDIRRLPNGNITLYDNGVGRDPEYSRALEYEIDEVAKTARLVWEYRTDPDSYGRIMGSFARREDGSALINWGGNPGAPQTLTHSVTEVHPDGSTALDLRLPSNSWSYRAYRFPWQSGIIRAEETELDFGSVAPGDTATLALPIQNLTSAPLELRRVTSTDGRFEVLTEIPVTVQPGGSVSLDVQFSPSALGPVEGKIYAITTPNDDFIAADVVVRGTGGLTAAASQASAQFVGLEPNPFVNQSTVAFDVLRPSRVILEVFTVRGRRVATILDEIRQPGRYQEMWEPGGVRPGIYFVRLRSDGVAETRRAVVLD